MKKFASVLLAAALVLSFAGCNSSKEEGSGDAATETKKSTVIKADETEAKEEVVETVETEPAIVAEEVAVGDTVSLDFATFTISDFEVNSEGYFFESTDTSSGIKVTHKCSLEPSNSQVSLVCLKGTFTNNSGEERYPSNDPMYGQMTVNGNTYSMRMECYIVEDADSQLTLIAGLPVDCFFYAEVPTAIATNIESCEVTFGFVENLEPGFIMGIEDLDYVYTLTAIPNAG